MKNTQQKKETSINISKDEAGILTLEISNRAHKNAMTLAMWNSFAGAVEQADTDSDIRVIVIKGSGRGAFCSGADISEFAKHRRSPDDIANYDDTVAAAFSAIINTNIPTIAQIDGICYGAGLALAAMCDLRIATTNAKISIPAAKLGIAYQPLWIKRLLDITSPEFVSELLFTAGVINGSLAATKGLCGVAVDDSDIDNVVTEISNSIASNAPLSIKASKVSIREALKPSHAQNWDLAHQIATECNESRHLKTAVEAFMDRTKSN